MNNFRMLLINLLKDESGQDLIEYALIAGLIAVAAIVTMGTVGTKISTGFSSLGSQIGSALP